LLQRGTGWAIEALAAQWDSSLSVYRAIRGAGHGLEANPWPTTPWACVGQPPAPTF